MTRILHLPREIEALNDEYRDIAQQGRLVVDGLTDEDLARRPADGSWSIAECLDHLVATNRSYLRKMGRAVAANAPQSARPRFRHTLAGGWMRRMMEPPVRRRLPAPRKFRPAPERRPAAERLAEFLAVQDELIAFSRSAAELDVAKIKFSSPVTRLLRLNLWDALTIIAAHERRHLWQARNVRAVIRPD